jgi:hypothetical protein
MGTSHYNGIVSSVIPIESMKGYIMSDLNAKIEAIASFKNVPANDIHAGIIVYSVAERSIGQLQGSISGWVYDSFMSYYNNEAEYEKVALLAFRAWSQEMQRQCDWIASNEAGGNKLKKSLAALEGNNTLGNAYKKVKAGMELGINFSQFSSLSAIADHCKELKKAAKEKAINDQAESDIAVNAKAKCLAEGLVEGTPEFEARYNELVAKLRAKHIGEVPQVGQEQAISIVMAEYNIPPELEAQATSILEAADKLQGVLIELLIEKTNEFHGKGDAACNQVLEIIEGQVTSWNNMKDKAHKMAVDSKFLEEDLSLEQTGS